MEITPILTIKNVAKQYDKGIYIEVEHLDIPKGFSVALIGENGAGKTSLLRLLSGIDRKILNSSGYSMGEIYYFDNEKNFEAIQNNIGYVSSHNYFLHSWTLNSMGTANELLYDNFSKEKYEALCDEWGLNEKKKRILTFSDGMKMKAALASAFARDTKLLLLDEPTSPLDPMARTKFCEHLRTYIDEGDGERSVLFSTHNIADMENATDYAIFIANGKIAEAGFVEDLKEKYILVKGEPQEAEKAKTFLMGFEANDYGYEGLCDASNLDKLAGLDIATETPTLSQISVAIIKYESERPLL